MKNSSELFYGVCFFITLFMTGITWLSWQRHRERELSHLTEFWASLSFHSIVMFVFHLETTYMAALTMLGWLWPIRTFHIVLEDISGAKIMGKWHYLILGVGVFMTFALGGYGFPFTMFTLPFSLAVGLTGLHVTYFSYRRTSREHLTPLHVASYILFGLFFVRRALYPFWRMNPKYMDYGYYLELLFLIGFAGTGLATFVQNLRRKHEVQIERLLKERSEKLLGQNKFSELGMMAAGIAHEINNPLAVIQARATQLLRIYRNPEKQKELGDGLQQILFTSERINKTIQGVREFVHQDENGPKVVVPLKEVMDNVLSFTGQRMKNHGVNLRFYGLENYSVLGNKIQLEQVILNLLNNSFDAIEFLPDKWIEVSCHHRGNKVQLYFKDSGNGIPADIASKIMEPFFSTKDIGKGTGLGLALARGIAEQHGGSLSYVEDSPHTTFLLELPKLPEQEWGAHLH